MMKLIQNLALAFTIVFSGQLFAAENYNIDTKGMHASIEFKIKHLGYSWLKGRFNDFGGNFTYDAANPANANVNVTIKTASIDSNHGERDKHLRNKDFLDVEEYPEATFVSTKVVSTGKGTAKIHGDLTLHGVTKEVIIDAVEIGAGNDPWGGYRRGFEGTTTFALADFGITYNLGPASTHVEMILYIEGIRK